MRCWPLTSSRNLKFEAVDEHKNKRLFDTLPKNLQMLDRPLPVKLPQIWKSNLQKWNVNLKIDLDFDTVPYQICVVCYINLFLVVNIAW